MSPLSILTVTFFSLQKPTEKRRTHYDVDGSTLPWRALHNGCQQNKPPRQYLHPAPLDFVLFFTTGVGDFDGHAVFFDT